MLLLEYHSRALGRKGVSRLLGCRSSLVGGVYWSYAVLGDVKRVFERLPDDVAKMNAIVLANAANGEKYVLLQQSLVDGCLAHKLRLEDANILFNNTPQHNVASWNNIVGVYADQRSCKRFAWMRALPQPGEKDVTEVELLVLFHRMLWHGRRCWDESLQRTRIRLTGSKGGSREARKRKIAEQEEEPLSVQGQLLVHRAIKTREKELKAKVVEKETWRRSSEADQAAHSPRQRSGFARSFAQVPFRYLFYVVVSVGDALACMHGLVQWQAAHRQGAISMLEIITKKVKELQHVTLPLEATRETSIFEAL
ncbi:hypothetical protein SELMODRAFT_427513 [Selaginella moellendorffii]|uniref:Uncharacterized protein n=1 Tax=Selaginella moellendorffii TaxID=88036 RepID=D8SZU8_SELML|nr:hypothetical protein SELMODRAFT_427513 [Selaginella moellendorffii]